MGGEYVSHMLHRVYIANAEFELVALCRARKRSIALKDDLHIRDHLLKALERALDLRARGHIVFDFVDERRKGYTPRIGSRIFAADVKMKVSDYFLRGWIAMRAVKASTWLIWPRTPFFQKARPV
jgi:hypothetical protein